MEIGINLGYLLKKRDGSRRTVEEAAVLAKNAGFRYLDYVTDVKAEDWLDRAKAEKELFDRMGLIVEQSHAPFNRYARAPWEDFAANVQKTFEAASILGAKHVVIHADEYSPEDGWNIKKIVDRSYEMFMPFVDFAAKHGMDVAFENLFEDGALPGSDGRSRFESTAEELLATLDRFSGEPVSVCWDFGHAQCSFGENNMLAELKKVGPRVSCTHVHDNYYGKDLHLMPFLGNVDWEGHMAYLHEVGYQGKMTYEFVYGHIPDALLPDMLALTHKVAEYLVSLAK